MDPITHHRAAVSGCQPYNMDEDLTPAEMIILLRELEVEIRALKSESRRVAAEVTHLRRFVVSFIGSDLE